MPSLDPSQIGDIGSKVSDTVSGIQNSITGFFNFWKGNIIPIAIGAVLLVIGIIIILLKFKGGNR